MKFMGSLILSILFYTQITLGQTLFIEMDNETNQQVYLEQLNHQYSMYSSADSVEKEDVEPDMLFLEKKVSKQLKVDVLSTMYFEGAHLLEKNEHNKKDGMLLKVGDERFFVYLDLAPSSLFKPMVYCFNDSTNKYTVEVSEDKNIPSFFKISIEEKKIAKK